MLTLRIDIVDVAVCLAIILRLAVLVFMLPPFNSARISSRIKAAIVLSLSCLLYPVLRTHVAPLPMEPISLIWMVVGELILGMTLSLCCLLLMAGLNLGADLISYQMGLSFAQIVDPQSGGQSVLFANIVQILTILLLLTFNVHHMILKVLVDSFYQIPVGLGVLSAISFERLVQVAGYLFILAIKFSAPVVVALFLVQVGLGVVTKFVPNINVFMTSLPLTILIGFLLVIFAIPLWGTSIGMFFDKMLALLQTVARSFTA